MRSIYGFGVEASGPITEFLRDGEPSTTTLDVLHSPDLAAGPRVPTDEVVSWQPRPGVAFHGSVHRAGSGDLYIKTSDAGWFRLDIGQRRVEFGGEPSDLQVQVRLWVTPMLLLMTHMKRLPLHAASISTREGVVAIGGPGRHGKTTLAAALCSAGCKLYAEDITCVDGNEVIAGPGLIRLRPDAEHRFELGTLTEVGRTEDRLFLRDSGSQPEPAPLRAVVLLRNTETFELVALDGPAALPDLWALSFHLPYAEDRRRAFAGIAALADTVELFDLRRPKRWESLPSVVEALLDRFGGPA